MAVSGTLTVFQNKILIKEKVIKSCFHEISYKGTIRSPFKSGSMDYSFIFGVRCCRHFLHQNPIKGAFTLLFIVQITFKCSVHWTSISAFFSLQMLITPYNMDGFSTFRHIRDTSACKRIQLWAYTLTWFTVQRALNDWKKKKKKKPTKLCQDNHTRGPLHFAGKFTSCSPEIGGSTLSQILVRSQFIRSS